jgi:hypothetical protein
MLYQHFKAIVKLTAILLTVYWSQMVNAQSAIQAQKVAQQCMQMRQLCTNSCQNQRVQMEGMRSCVIACTEIESRCIKKAADGLKK